MNSHTSTTTLLLLLFCHLSSAATSPYLSPTTLPQNYQNMLSTFKIFIYTPTQPFTFETPPSSEFYTFLLNSPFLTDDPEKAHFFLLPFSPNTSNRALGRLVKEVRTQHPYWNRTLGADHFFISPQGIDHSSDRNVVELKKNAVQISTFPTISGNFIPHKDVTLPPFIPNPLAIPHTPDNSPKSFVGYLRWDGESETDLVNELRGGVDFVIEYSPLDHVENPRLSGLSVSESLDHVESSESHDSLRALHEGRIRSSKFCLFLYRGDVTWIVEAISLGCVPVLIVDRPVQDLPLMDVLRWSEMGIVAGMRGGGKALKELLLGVGEERYEKMKGLCVEGSKHLVWNEEAQPWDAFHMVMYQLWLRRHTIRYTRRDLSST